MHYSVKTLCLSISNSHFSACCLQPFGVDLTSAVAVSSGLLWHILSMNGLFSLWLFGEQSIECTCSSNLLFNYSLFIIIHRLIKWLWWEWTPYPISKPKAVVTVQLLCIICLYVTGQNITTDVSCNELVVHEISGEPKSFVLGCGAACFLQTSITSTESSRQW